jgi:acetyl-CoA C-acetyltransferase
MLSTINDGVAVNFNMRRKSSFFRFKTIGFIKSYADAAQEPKWFTIVQQKHSQSTG